ncbi:spermatogenesis-associated protein 20 isoform X1 [Bombyx mori]|uniref:Spermatogenesis-associated protein 20-like TRX domain-containing protein n=1 Tax=Bombyx mori TaxID=7091 RepID=A0A8R2AS43_BOMMO|nr:spermatogenesis-associated protein 20 isoform X1 [Bombyx mori]
MPSGRAVLLLRRLSTGDNRLKNINLNQNISTELFTNPVCIHRDLGLHKRLSTVVPNSISPSQITRSFSDNKIIMASPSSETPPVADKPKHTNSLINEKSPYLLQHAHNPVQWYPWGPEAIEKAKVQNKLIFLSVGYSTCHWCHVMEKESFENEEVAKIMNEHYVNIKVDREERPDIDRVYLLFVMASTGSGGWPMSVFLTPDLQPVTGGTYFPPEDRWGRPGFKTVLLTLAKKWKENQQQCLEAGQHVISALQQLSLDDNLSSVVPGEGTWDKCVQKYMLIYEPEFGGFGMAPKFPQASIFNFLFHYYARDKSNTDGKKCLEMCLYTLTKIAKGGIHDHVSSGFARYSVDNDWHVPHFEKMLYDQAQLVVAYTDAFLATKDEFYAVVVHDIIKYVNRDLRHESGGYYSAEDADSYPTFGTTKKKEGAFCVWEYSELKALLNDKKINEISYLDIFCEYFSVSEEGNISPGSDPHGELVNKNVLIIYESKEEISKKFGLNIEQFNQVINDCIKIVYEARQNRPRPDLDTKILCSWNGLMLSGLAQAGQGLGEKCYVEDAIKTANFIKENLYDVSTNTLLHSCYRDENGAVMQIGKPIKGFLDDYAFLIKGLLDLYEASFDRRWLNWARELQDKQNEMFWDSEGGGYFTCSTEDKTIVLRLKEDQDGAEPSGNSVSCHNLLRFAAYADKSDPQNSGEKEREMAKKILVAFAKRLNDSPTALPEMMSALMFYSDSPTQVLISGGRSDPRTLEMVRAVRTRLLPGRVLCVADPADTPAGMSDILLHRVRSAGDVPTAYVCRRYACSLPVTDVKQLENLLDETPAAVAKK